MTAKGEVILCDKHGYHVKPDLYYGSTDSFKEATAFFIQDAIAICTIKGSLQNSMLIPEEFDGQAIAHHIFSPKPIADHYKQNPALYTFISQKLNPIFPDDLEVPIFSYKLYEDRKTLGLVNYRKNQGWEFSKNRGVFTSTAPGAIMEHKPTRLESLTIMKVDQIVPELTRLSLPKLYAN